MAIQGIGLFIRKSLSLATITLDIAQYKAVPKSPSDAAAVTDHVDIVLSAAGLRGSKEQRCLDNLPREHKDWVFGSMTLRSRWVTIEELDESILEGPWEFEKGAGSLILDNIESPKGGWSAKQVLGIQVIDGRHRFCRTGVVQNRSRREEFKLVFDYHVSSGCYTNCHH